MVTIEIVENDGILQTKWIVRQYPAQKRVYSGAFVSPAVL